MTEVSSIKHYHYNNQIQIMDSARVKNTLTDLEIKTRSGEFSYSSYPKITQKQLADIQKTWSPELFSLLKEKVKDLTVKAGLQKANPETTYQAMLEILHNEVVNKRATKKAVATPIETLHRKIDIDVAVSMVMDCAPDASDDGSLPRTIKDQKIDIRYTTKPNKVVINCNEADSDIYVFAFSNVQIGKVILLGWAKKQDIRVAERGNKTTDPKNCSWSTMSYWMPIRSLRPMGSLAREFGIKELNQGMVFEQVPEQFELPIPSDAMDNATNNSNKSNGDDFYDIIGISDPSKAKTEEATKKEETFEL